MMSQKEIQDSEGNILPIQGVSKDESSVIVRLKSGSLAYVPIRLLSPRTPELYSLPVSFHDLHLDEDTQVLPVIEERPFIQKRKVETESVKIRKTVREIPEVIEESLAREEVQVERIPMNETRDEPAQMRTEGDTVIIPVQEEVLVVQKKILVREEIRVTRKRIEHNEKVTVNLKTEEVLIDRKKIN